MIRVLVGLGVLAVCGEVLVAVGMPASALPVGEVARHALPEDPGLLAAAEPSHWIVRVDGWSLEFDGVEGAQPPPVPEPAELDAAEYMSPFDALIAEHAARAGLDWRLVSALIFEESGFNATVESDDGAYGLMQVSAVAAREIGAKAYRKPEANISAGVRYLKRLSEMFAGATERDGWALALAAYNAGPGHLQDAQLLAARFGYDPSRWDGSMDKMLPLLERPAIHSKLPNGFAYGGRTVRYVNRVLDRFTRLRGVLGPAPLAKAATASGGNHAASASG